MPQNGFHRGNAFFDVGADRSHPQLIGASQTVMLVLLHQHDDLGGINAVVFAKSEQHRFGARINAAHAQSLGLQANAVAFDQGIHRLFDVPQVALRLRVGNTGEIAQALLDHDLDLACVEGPVIHPQLEVRAWREDALVVCVPPQHRLAALPVVRAKDFAGERWILREPGSATRSLSEQALAKLPPPRGVLELSQTEAIKQAVVAGLGIACLPEVAIRDAVATGQLVALATPFLALQRTLSLLVHRKRYRGAALAAFLRMA